MAERTILARYQGDVQGVGFRATVQRLAGGFAIKGWVKNEPDGSVSMIASGDPREVDAFLAAIRGIIQRGGGSRGSHCVLDEAGVEMHPGLIDPATQRPYRFKPENEALRDHVLCVRYNPEAADLFDVLFGIVVDRDRVRLAEVHRVGDEFHQVLMQSAALDCPHALGQKLDPLLIEPVLFADFRGLHKPRAPQIRHVFPRRVIRVARVHDRINQQRFITLTANIYDKDLGTASTDVNAAIRSLGELPKGVKIISMINY